MNREVKEAVTRTSLTYHRLIDSHMTAKDKTNLNEWAQWKGYLYLVKSEVYSCVWCSDVVSSGSGGWRHVKAHLNDAPPGCHHSYIPCTLLAKPLVGVGVVRFFSCQTVCLFNITARVSGRVLVCEVLFHRIKTCGASAVFLSFYQSQQRKKMMWLYIFGFTSWWNQTWHAFAERPNRVVIIEPKEWGR